MLHLEKVMLADGTSALAALDKLDARVRFSRRGPIMERDGHGGFTPKQPGYDIAEIIDKTTGESYASGTGVEADIALRSALIAAATAPKPLTKAQKADPAFTAQAKTIADLTARLAKLEGQTPPATADDRVVTFTPDAKLTTLDLTRGQKAAATRAKNKAAKVAAS